MSQGDSPEVAAAIAERKKSLDLQSGMAILGMAVVSAIFAVDLNDRAASIAGLANILPWFLGLSVLIVAFNRWTLSLNAAALRRAAGELSTPARKP